MTDSVAFSGPRLYLSRHGGVVAAALLVPMLFIPERSRPISLMGLFLWCLSMFDRLRYFQGQLIAYGGGSLVSLWSSAATAANDLTSSIPNLTTNDLIGIGGLIVIAFRFVFDVFVYFDKRRKRNQEE